ncbi:MAG: Ig-like domain-containing protein, partial [Myxococcales bacterium]|nr:Ig-like domain-containing protein [Myxococcales bacterium]
MRNGVFNVARTAGILALAVLLQVSSAGAAGLPNQSYPTDLAFQIISPQMDAAHHNQPHALAGYLLLAGNGTFGFWDISDPFRPARASEFLSPYRFGEAESHTISFRKRPDGALEAVTISGRGVDFWDVTDPRSPRLLSSMLLEGVDYGDATAAVWGVFWEGRYVYVGGTNTGLHVVDAADAAHPVLVTRVPTAAFGDVSAGPVFALGNLLVITTPKNTAGVATLDISDPAHPTLLDFEKPATASYIGGFYGRHAHLLTPYRTYDVTTDPANIALVGSAETPASEYMSFADGYLFLGALRPRPGVFKIDIADPNHLVFVGKVNGRIAFNIDDQFSVPIGNLLVISDDQANYGSVLAVHDSARDTTPPTVAYVNPPDGAANQALTSRVGLSFTDQIDLTTVDPTTLIVRPVGGAPLTGAWGHMQTLVTFWPDAPLAPDTTYEVLVPAGGITDLVGNAIPATFRSVFSTGAAVDALGCGIAGLSPVTPGEAAAF